jgi:light-regulated signal transduction histidine kinase (bacteriophytochrome)
MLTLSDPDKQLEPDGTLTPRNSFAAYVEDHFKKGKPWDATDRQLISRFSDQLEKHRTKELNLEHSKTIKTLEKEKAEATETARVNFDFFAVRFGTHTICNDLRFLRCVAQCLSTDIHSVKQHMAHELRTPFHGMVGSLEAMREDPVLRNNEMLKTAELCGKSMIKILDDILLVAKGSYDLQIEEHLFDLKSFVKITANDMSSFALMEGAPIQLGKELIFCKDLVGDSQRIRQVMNNLLSNAIKFSEVRASATRLSPFLELASHAFVFLIVYVGFHKSGCCAEEYVFGSVGCLEDLFQRLSKL